MRAAFLMFGSIVFSSTAAMAAQLTPTVASQPQYPNRMEPVFEKNQKNQLQQNNGPVMPDRYGHSRQSQPAPISVEQYPNRREKVFGAGEKSPPTKSSGPLSSQRYGRTKNTKTTQTGPQYPNRKEKIFESENEQSQQNGGPEMPDRYGHKRKSP